MVFLLFIAEICLQTLPQGHSQEEQWVQMQGTAGDLMVGSRHGFRGFQFSNYKLMGYVSSGVFWYQYHLLPQYIMIYTGYNVL